jgi:hypothetical protein
VYLVEMERFELPQSVAFQACPRGLTAIPKRKSPSRRCPRRVSTDDFNSL